MSEVNAKIDKLKQLHAAGATGQEAWAKTTAAVQRDIEDADEVLGKIAMETRRCAKSCLPVAALWRATGVGQIWGLRLSCCGCAAMLMHGMFGATWFECERAA